MWCGPSPQGGKYTWHRLRTPKTAAAYYTVKVLKRLLQHTATAAPVPLAKFTLDEWRLIRNVLDCWSKPVTTDYKGTSIICKHPATILSESEDIQNTDTYRWLRSCV